MDYYSNEDIVDYFFDKIKYFTLPSERNNYRSKFLESNTLLYCVVLLLAFKIATIFVSINIPQNIFFADITKMSLENLVNQTRQSFGLQPLTKNIKLDQAAESKAKNMVANNYFAHTSPTGVSPWHWFSQAGYNYKYAGENLAIGFFDSQEVYNAWLNSPEHRANIINPNYKEIGTAVLAGYGNNNTIVVVQEFGSQLPVKTVTTAKNNAPKVPVTQPKTTAPVATTNPAPVVNEKVLSQSTEVLTSQESAKPASSNYFYKIMNSILYNYSGLLQDVIYGVSLVVIGILLAMIFFNANANFGKHLVFRSVLIIILLSLATVLNKELIISIIPHRVII